MKTRSIKSVMMALLLSVTLYSCGGDNGSGNGDGTTNYSNTLTGTPTNDSTLSTIQNFENNVRNGNFKAPKSSLSGFYYVKDIYSTSSNSSTSFQTYFYCNIPFICDSGETNSVQAADIMTRTLNSNGSITRQSIDDGLSSDQAALKNILADKIRDARVRSNPYTGTFFMQIRSNAFIFKPGDNYEYVVDLNVPLAGNPVFRRNLNTGETYDFLSEEAPY